MATSYLTDPTQSAGDTPAAPPPKPLVKTPATASPSATGIMTVRSPSDLQKIAESQVDSDISGQVAPLQGQIGELDARSQRAQTSIADMFGSILPASETAATNLSTEYGQALTAEQGIMNSATQRLNQLKQSRAQEAQALAQEIGGPVSVGEFTSSMGSEPDALTALGSGQMLHTLGMEGADVADAQAFAGRVLPLVQTEQSAQARKYYEDQVTDLQKQIATLQGTKSSKVNSTLNDLLVQERTFQLQKAQNALDELKAKHDWNATKSTLHSEDARLKLAEDQFALQKAGVTGSYKGSPTLSAKNAKTQAALESRRLTLSEKQMAQQLGISNRAYALATAKLQTSTSLSESRMAVGQRKAWAGYLDAATDPKPGRTITTTTKVPVPQTAAVLGKAGSGVFADASSSTGYSRLVTTHEPAPNTAHPITNPTELVDYLQGHGVPKQVAVGMVRSRLSIGTWNYGEPDPRVTDTAHHGR